MPDTPKDAKGIFLAAVDIQALHPMPIVPTCVLRDLRRQRVDRARTENPLKLFTRRWSAVISWQLSRSASATYRQS
jgi:hypothetical protein